MNFHRGPLPGEPAGATFAEVAGARVRYLDVGPTRPQERPAPAVVLLHGFASSLDNWSHVIPALADRHRVLGVDLKGFGWTDRPPGDYSPGAQADLVLALMDERKIERAALVGHSWGASVALALTLRAPERVARLALYDAWVYEEQLPSMFHWARAHGVGETLFGLFYAERADQSLSLAFHDRTHITPALRAQIRSALERPGTAAAALAAVRGQRYAAVQREYRRIKHPTLILWGREDHVAPLSFGERLARDLKASRLVVYPHCGHFPMLEAAVESTRDLADFLGETLAGIHPTSLLPLPLPSGEETSGISGRNLG